MSDRRLAPQSGWPPPPEYRAQAEIVCRRHFALHPDQIERYGEHGMAWCVHDLQHILAWAAGDVAGHVDFEKEIRWLAGVLASRDFPLHSMVDDLEIAAEIAPELSEPLLRGASIVRELSAST